MISIPAQSAAANGTEPTNTLNATKTLKGKINLLDAEFEQAGIKLDDDQLPSTISMVKEGSAADAANIGRGDQVLAASLDKQFLILRISRNGRNYAASIDLRADGLVKESVQLPGHAQSSVARKRRGYKSEMPYAGILEIYSEMASKPSFQRAAPANGWTQQAIAEDLLWQKEYHYLGIDGPMADEWNRRIKAAAEFEQRWMRQHFPKKLYLGHDYHLAITRDGQVKAIYPMDLTDAFGSQADSDKYAYPLIRAISDSRIFAAPAASKVTTFHIGIVIRNTPNGEWDTPKMP